MYQTPRRKSYALLFKLKVANEVLVDNKEVQATARKYNIANKTVRDWVGKIDEIKGQLNKRNNRLSFRIRKRGGDLNEMESLLFGWIKQERSNGACVSSKAIKLKAVELHNQIDATKEFKSSNGWFERFLKRHGLCCRRLSSTGRDLPNNCQEIVNLFLQDCKKLNQFDDKAIYNMDEASIYLDSPGNFNF